MSILYQLKLCRECKAYVCPKGFGLCHSCMDYIELRLNEHRARPIRTRERCAKPTCMRPFREGERIAIEPHTLKTFCWTCFPATESEVQT